MNPSTLSLFKTRILLSVFVILVAVLSATAGLEALSERTPLSRLDAEASSYYEGALKRAIATYAIARMLNGAISAVQGTELAVSPAGMGLRLSVGEVLDPINDLIERFSWIMLMSTVSLGIQSVLMEIGSWFGFRVLVSASMVLLLLGLWIPRQAGAVFKSLGIRLLIASVVVRLCIPIIGVTSQALYDVFLAGKYERSTESLDVIRGKIRMPIVQPEEGNGEDGGLMDELRKKYQNTRQVLNVQARLEALKETVEAGIDHIINLIIVFVLQTLVAPLLVLWGLVRVAGTLSRPGWAGGGGVTSERLAVSARGAAA
ncbi:MAG: hypothetical protein ACQET7_07585 [Thermodesulfobacteriota bacterium]